MPPLSLCIGLGLPDGGRVVATAPTNSVAPVVSGSAGVGSVLTSTTGSWNGSPTGFAYQWKRDGSPIGGATSSTYTTVSADVSHGVTCTVTASNTAGSASATSNATTVTGIAPVNTVAPSIAGAVVINGTLTATPGTWTGTPTPTIAGQWYRGASPIGGATSTTYTPVAADIDPTVNLTYQETATNAAGSATATSNALTFNVRTSIGSTVQAWYRGDLGVTLQTGTNVQKWADQSGNGRDAVNNSGANQPTTGGSVGSHSRAALQFSRGVVELLASTADSILPAGTARTFFVVARSSDQTGGSIMRLRKATAYFSINLSGDGVYSDGANSAQNTSVTTGGLNPKTSDFYMAWKFPAVGSPPVIRMNATAKTIAAGVQGTENGTTGWEIGRGALLWDGVIAEIVVCDTALSTDLISTLEAYAQNYYGLA